MPSCLLCPVLPFCSVLPVRSLLFGSATRFSVCWFAIVWLAVSGCDSIYNKTCLGCNDSCVCSFISVHIQLVLDVWVLIANGSTLNPSKTKARLFVCVLRTRYSYTEFSALLCPHWLKTIALDVSGLMSEELGAYLSAQLFQNVWSRLLIVSFCSLSGTLFYRES